MDKELKEIQNQLQKNWDEIKNILDQQQDEIRTHSEVLEKLIEQFNL